VRFTAKGVNRGRVLVYSQGSPPAGYLLKIVGGAASHTIPLEQIQSGSAATRTAIRHTGDLSDKLLEIFGGDSLGGKTLGVALAPTAAGDLTLQASASCPSR